MSQETENKDRTPNEESIHEDYLKNTRHPKHDVMTNQEEGVALDHILGMLDGGEAAKDIPAD